MSNDEMTVPEVVARLGMTPAQVYRRIHAGHLEARRFSVGGKERYLIDAGSVERYSRGESVTPLSALMRAVDAARVLGLPPERVRKMMSDGTLECREHGSKRWVTRESLERFIGAAA